MAIAASPTAGFACRAAAFDDRYKAVVSVRQLVQPPGTLPRDGSAVADRAQQYMGENAEHGPEQHTWRTSPRGEGAAGLQIYGGLDKASPSELATGWKRK